MEYAESIARSLEFLRAEYNSPSSSKAKEGWVTTGEVTGVEASMLQKDGEDFVTVRGRMTMQGISPKQVQDLIIDCVGRPQWDDQLQEGSFATSFGQLRTAMLPPCSADIIRLIYKGMPPVVKGRDLCLLRAWGSDEDGSCWLVAESCADEAVPVDGTYIRAELRECGYMMTPVPGGCEVVYISQTKMNGWIPAWFNNVLVTQQPYSLEAMYRVLTDKLSGA